MNNSLEEFFEKIITVKWGPERKSLDIIDQTLLPGTIKRINLSTKEEIWEAIKKLRVRGAPAIGVAAAYGLAVLSDRIEAEDYEAFYKEFKEIKDYLASSRPTAVNLFWALNRIDGLLVSNADKSVKEIKSLIFNEAQAIRDEDVAISRSIGEIGYGLLMDIRKAELKNKQKNQENDFEVMAIANAEKVCEAVTDELGILTHCNAGTLATAKYGTATAPMYIALEHGIKGDEMHVYCDETRPLLQGARLTSFELSNAGIKTSVQCDNMVASLLKSGRVKIIFVGCDRVAANGDAANKIGTSGLAIIAKYYGVPFYVCAPSSTIDMATKTGDDIPIEMRDPEEIKSMWYVEPMAPAGADASFNPAFDVTDHELITGIITEKGLCQAPFEESFRKLGIE